MINSVLQRAGPMSVADMVQGMIDTLNDALVDAGKHRRGHHSTCQSFLVPCLLLT